MRALKDNKEYTISEESKQRYLEEGYDIYSDSGELLEYSPKKKIEYSKYAEAINERDLAVMELEKLKESSDAKIAEENKALKAEIKAIKKDAAKKELEELKKAGE